MLEAGGWRECRYTKSPLWAILQTLNYDELASHLARAIEPFGLSLDRDVALFPRPAAFEPSQSVAAVATFFGAEGASDAPLDYVLRTRTPVLPIVSTQLRVTAELPERLRALSCLFYDVHGALRVSTAILECLGLLPRQRRVFVSYRRDEARSTAVQFFNELSSRLFDVFLDTHGIAPADDFQAVLWHRLCDSDVLVMLDTPQYFESRWTSAEFGRALAKDISVLRVGWPGVDPSPRVGTASRFDSRLTISMLHRAWFRPMQ